VSNGTDAVAQVMERAFDVLLLDIQMPDSDGYDVTRRIRQFEESRSAPVAAEGAAEEGAVAKHLPIIALTAHVGVEVRKRCLSSGMDGYLSKPVRASELFSVLEGVLIEGDGTASDGETPAPEPMDWEQLDAFVGGDARVRQSVLEAAVKLLPETLLTIETALQALDFVSVKEDAHRLTGMAGNIGARDLSAAAASLEREAARQDMGGGRARLVEMRSECDRLIRFLDASAAAGV
jgi:two-component system, sensor histidine kinase and response regulator